MADETADGAAAVQPDAAAVHVALGAAGASEEAREYLRKQSGLAAKQSEIADLQIDSLRKKDEFELSHLRFRRFSDWARFALEIAGFLVVALIVCGLGSMVWSASQDRDLVVDSFSVPSDVAQSGITGTVLAGRVLDRFGAMEAGVWATTQAAAAAHGAGGEELRVEIPDTGISIGQLDRILRGWLGHETHISGDLVHVGKTLALTVRYGAAPGATFAGADLDSLVRQSTEHLFAASRPLRYGEYLMGHGRAAEAFAVIVPLAMRGDDKARALAYADWAQALLFQGHWWDALDKARQAVRLDPQNPTAMGWLCSADVLLRHDEAAYREAVAAVPLWRGPGAAGLDPNTVAGGPSFFTASAAHEQGDYPTALANYEIALRVNVYDSAVADRAADAARDHDIGAAMRLAALIRPRNSDGTPNAAVPEAQWMIAEMRGDWAGAVRNANAAEILRRKQPAGSAFTLRFVWPRLARALARTGNIAGAETLIRKTPLDCDECVRMRGVIAGMKRDWAGAAACFKTVSDRSPDIPFADTDWGEMLMRKGDLDGAIAHFAIANKRSPHFADPLEMWGEALIAKNRSDLALAKFQEADKYAPNWGRLHLNWGEALWWSGDKDGARKQFAIASHSDLAPSEKSELAKMGIRHG